MQQKLFHFNSILKPLCSDNLKPFCRLDARQNCVFVNAVCNFLIAMRAVVNIQSIWINLQPKLFVAQRFKVFLKLLYVLEYDHSSNIPNPGFAMQIFGGKQGSQWL